MHDSINSSKDFKTEGSSIKKTLLEKALQGRFRDIGDRLGELSWKDKEALLVEHLEW